MQQCPRPDVLLSCCNQLDSAPCAQHVLMAAPVTAVRSFEDGLKLVKLRGESMQAAADAVPSAMVSVIGLDADRVTWPTTTASKAARSRTLSVQTVRRCHDALKHVLLTSAAVALSSRSVKDALSSQWHDP